MRGRRRFKIDAEPVRQQGRLLDVSLAAAGQHLEVNVSSESEFFPQQPGGLNHLLSDAVLIPSSARGEKEPFDVVGPVKGMGYPGQLFRSVGEGFGFIATAGGIDAIAALVGAVVSEKGLEEAHASAVLGEGVADSGQRLLPRRVGGGADIVAGALTEAAKLLGVYSASINSHQCSAQCRPG